MQSKPLFFLGGSVCRDHFRKLPATRFRHQVDEQPASVDVVPLLFSGEFAFDLHCLYAAVGVLDQEVRRIFCLWQFDGSINLFWQEKKGDVQRHLDDFPGLHPRQNMRYVILLLSPAVKVQTARIRRARLFLRRPASCLDLPPGLVTVTRRQIVKLHPQAQG